MKKFVFTLVVIICAFLESLAQHVNVETAQLVASNFWRNISADNLPARWENVSPDFGFSTYYILENTNRGGFVIVAADRRVQPILAYSTNGNITKLLPDNVRGFLQEYENEIGFYQRNGVEPTNDIDAQWNSLLSGTYSPASTSFVEPLLTTTWNQSPYYNNFCPDSSGVHAVAGCAAIATAQVMKYWNWPTSGTGSHSYELEDFGEQSADFGNTVYNWSSMPNFLNSSSSAAQVNAVATLVYHVGVAIEMEYGIHGSGAIVNSYGYSTLPCSENALKDYFKYKETLHSVYKNSTSNNLWVSTLKTELDAGRPIIERGDGDGGGHAFVCDGYDENGLFHINWGWGGYMDGYFAHNALNPGEGGTGGNNDYHFSDNIAVIVGIEPAGKLLCHPHELSFPQGGGAKTFTVTPNNTVSSGWNATSSQSWLTVSPSSGTVNGGAATVSATVSANNTGHSRAGTITVSQGSETQTITVVQEACSANEKCTVILEMNDSYGDGWNNAHLTLSSGDGFVYGTATCSGNSTTQQFQICPSSLTLTWNPGNYDHECTFKLYAGNGQVLLEVNTTPSSSYTVSEPCSGSSQPDDNCTISNFPWNESFEGDLSCWTTIDADGDGNNWFSASGASQDGTYSVASYSYNSDLGGSLNANNYLISPYISLPSNGNYNLSFFARCANASYPDSMIVKLTTNSGNLATDFNVTLMPVTKIGTSYEEYSISLAGYSGQTVKIAFIHKSYDGHYLVLDNVSISGTSQTNYTVSVSPANLTMGSVTGGGVFAAGDTALIEATAYSGYRFTGWSDGSTVNPRSVAVSGNISIVAYFDNLGVGELHYDNGTFENTVGAGGSLYWGIRLPSNVLTAYNTLTSVLFYCPQEGEYQLRVHEGGANAPGTDIATQTYQISGESGWYEITFNTPITFSNSQSLWITFHNSGVNFPASGSNYAGNPDGSWISVDGSSWNSVCDYNLHYTWMIRAALSYSTTPVQQYSITVMSSNNEMGYATGGGTYDAGSVATLRAIASGHNHFVSWNDGNTQNPRYVTVTGDATYIATFAKNQYEITVVSANPELGSASGGGVFDYGTERQISAHPLNNCEFVKWNDGNTDNPRTITVTGDKTYTASFRSTVGIQDGEIKDIHAYSVNNTIIVEEAEGLSIELYDVTGKLLFREQCAESDRITFTVGASGVYLVKCGNGVAKKVQVIK